MEGGALQTITGVGTKEGCSEQLAAFLCARRDLIIEAWIAAVRKDRRIPTADTITRQQLRNHLPQMMNDLADALRGEAEVRAAPDGNAERHGQHRWQEGYELSEVMHELARLRTVFVEALYRF